jgi:alpha-beta hydrolase superfamily lysophospholipase
MAEEGKKMRRKMLAFAVPVLLAVLLIGCSHMPTRESPSEIAPDDLDAWLSEREARIPGIRSGTEKQIGDEVIVIGASTGVPLAAWLAAEVRESEDQTMHALIFISANFLPANRSAKIILWPGGRILTRLAVGKYTGFEPKNEMHAYYWTSSYLSKALRPMMQACRLGTNAPLEEIRVPVLFLYTENDEVVSIPALLEAYERFGSEEKSLINVSEARDHNMAGDIISPETTQITVDHILRFLGRIR